MSRHLSCCSKMVYVLNRQCMLVEKYRINYDIFWVTTVENVLRTTGCPALNTRRFPEVEERGMVCTKELYE